MCDIGSTIDRFNSFSPPPFSQLLIQASPAELEPVLSMYLTLLEETKSSLTFKVREEHG